MYNFEHDDVENSYYIEEEAFTEDDFESALQLWSESLPTPHPLYINPLTTELQSLEPTFLRDSMGNSLIYPGEITLFVGMPQSYKSWLLLNIVATANVAYWDFENGIPAIQKRLRGMEISPLKTMNFAFPADSFEVMELVKDAINKKYDVVAIDGLSALLRKMGKDGDNNSEVAEVFERVLEPLKKAGIAVVSIEHLPKSSKEGKDDFPIGAQTKKSIPGLLYLIRSRQDSNIKDLYLIKDRHYSISERCGESGSMQKYGTVELVTNDGPIRVLIRPCLVAYVDGIEINTADINQMEKLLHAIKDDSGSSLSAIDAKVGGQHKRNRDLLRTLEEWGNIEIKISGSTHKHYFKKNLSVAWEQRGSN